MVKGQDSRNRKSEPSDGDLGLITRKKERRQADGRGGASDCSVKVMARLRQSP